MSVEFTIRAALDPQTVPRLLEHFASRNLIPEWVLAEIMGDYIRIVIRHAAMDDRLVDIIAEKMRFGVLIERVEIVRIGERQVRLAADG